MPPAVAGMFFLTQVAPRLVVSARTLDVLSLLLPATQQTFLVGQETYPVQAIQFGK